jgi:hypothetical protein
MTEIELTGVSIAHTTIKTEEAVYRQALADERLDFEYDAYLSDMDEETVLIEPDGTVVSPYGNRVDLMDLVSPVLDQIPTWQVEQYVAARRGEEGGEK